jgi:hypothetical protein
MKVNVLATGRWFRYIGTSPVSYESKNTKIIIGMRHVYSLVQNKDKFFLFTKDMEQRIELDRGQAELLVNSSKPFLGRVNGVDIQAGDETFNDTFPKSVPVGATNENPDPDPEEEELIRPKISGSVPLVVTQLEEAKRTDFGWIHPMTSNIVKLTDKALTMIGTKVKFKRPIKLGVSTEMGTCIIHSFNGRSGLYDVYIVINPRQLTMLFGSVNAKVVAQVLTHELGHYVVKNVLRNSDKMKFKKLLAAKQVHKDQFNHPGYNNPWWDEAFAIMCEAMVHGRSARGFSTTLGWEIAEKYFVNVFVKDGEYSGSTESM